MTLEKLLIFGFALAVFTALAVTGKNMMVDHEPRYDGYSEKVRDLVDLTVQ
jgi:hypothetical protein